MNNNFRKLFVRYFPEISWVQKKGALSGLSVRFRLIPDWDGNLKKPGKPGTGPDPAGFLKFNARTGPVLEGSGPVVPVPVPLPPYPKYRRKGGA